jgi:CBS domain-containing protein
MNTTVKDVMTTQVVAVRRETTFKEVAATLRENRVSAFPVLADGGKVIGVVSEADLLIKVALGGGHDGVPGMITGILRHKEQEKARGITADDLMTGPAVTVAPEDTVERADRLMYRRRVKRLPVVDADGHLAGIISRADALTVFDRSDEEICEEIAGNVIPDEFLAAPYAFTVTVKDGVVPLAGKPDTSEVGRELVRRVGHVQGMVTVRDRFSYLPPGAPSLSGPTFFPVDLMPGPVRDRRHRRRLPHADRTGRRGVARSSPRLRAQTRGRSVGSAFDSEGYAGGLTFARHHLGGSGLVSCSLAVSRTVSSSSPYRAFSVFPAATGSPAGIRRHRDPPAARPPEPASLTSSSGRKPAPAQRPLASPADPDPSRCYPAVGVVTVPGPRERNGDQGCA